MTAQVHTKIHYKFTLNGKEFSGVIRALKKAGANQLAEMLLQQRLAAAKCFYEQAKEALDFIMVADTEIKPDEGTE